MTSTEQLKNYFEKDIFVKNCGITIVEVTDAYAKCTVEINAAHMNAEGLVQGGLIYTLADFTFAVLANSLHPVSLTQSAMITYLSATKSHILNAKAVELAISGRTCVHEVTITDIDDKTVATVLVNGFIKGQTK